MPLKTKTVTIRMEPTIKGLLETAASVERRSLGNMVEIMIVKYARELGIEGISQVPPSTKSSRVNNSTQRSSGRSK
jgi:hypothetical protein